MPSSPSPSLRRWHCFLRRGTALGLTAAALAPIAVTPASMAQDVADETVMDLEVEEVTVTGSRIKRPNLSAPNPVTVLGTEDITLSGDVNVVDIVNDIPALLGSNNSTANTAGFGTLGAATLNLRNLGEERTLVLVDGRRHVGGVAGEATVDVNTIPPALIERVEVLTGGASAIYGADAVSGVVNFIKKDDFEGLDVRGQYNLSDNGDGGIFNVNATAGANLADGRGNVTFSVNYANHRPLTQGDRFHTRGDRVASDWPNPALRIQQDDVSQFGLDRLLLGQSIDGFCGDGDSTLGDAKGSLCGRIDGAPARAVLPFPRFAVSNYGSIIGVDFLGDGFLSFFPDEGTVNSLGLDLGADGLVFDTNGNGIEDCFETAAGTLTQRFGGFAGCHVIDGVGTGVRPFEDGLIADSINQFGGDGTNSGLDGAFIVPNEERIVVNSTFNYQLTDSVRLFADMKYAYSEVFVQGPSVNSFYDSLPIRIDNPFIPDNLREGIETLVSDNPDVFNLEDVTVFIGRDLVDFGRNRDTSTRETFRFVGGFDGQLGDSTFDYEFSFNYGRTTADTLDENAILMDRFFAAADAVVDPDTGETVCRSSIETDANGNPVEPGAAFLPSRGIFPGFNTFDPLDGSCVPVNLFGLGGPSAEAVEFISTDLTREREIEQTVVSGFLTGDSSDWFTLPGGPVGVAMGGEYRRESSSFDAGVAEENGLVFDPRTTVSDLAGKFDVWEVFGEVNLPLLSGVTFAEELSLDAAVRYGDYSTIGGATTWKVGGTWAPINDIRFRGTFSQTIRAPNISELFSPLTGATARPVDPCDAGQIDQGSEFREANCRAEGIPEGFTDPLTARISGFTGGNMELIEETADTLTLGVVLQPGFIPGLTITADFYDIEIKDAIQAVDVQEIVNACYDLEQFPNAFCGQITRDDEPGSPTFNGLTSFVSSELNFAALETRGVDYELSYAFALGEIDNAMDQWGDIMLRVQGTWVDQLQRREDPTNPDLINPELQEGGQPKHAFNIDARWLYNDLTLNWQARFVGNVLEITPRVQKENADNFLNAFAGTKWRHDLSGTYRMSEDLQLYAGVNNVFDAKPILSQVSFPVGLMGRQFFFGIDASF
ncbi:TonB-dependent receptor domain-containing protein [Yunchengibacter salinarum]|uniref:TonB-dependent receptor domain-containing protein n=1 Tax=Yunchengibacter salinarum TaxID=3133399 RepID=UPI0035B66761